MRTGWREALRQALETIPAPFGPTLEPGDFNHPRCRSHPRHLNDELDHLRDQFMLLRFPGGSPFRQTVEPQESPQRSRGVDRTHSTPMPSSHRVEEWVGVTTSHLSNDEDIGMTANADPHEVVQIHPLRHRNHSERIAGRADHLWRIFKNHHPDVRPDLDQLVQKRVDEIGLAGFRSSRNDDAVAALERRPENSVLLRRHRATLDQLGE